MYLKKIHLPVVPIFYRCPYHIVDQPDPAKGRSGEKHWGVIYTSNESKGAAGIGESRSMKTRIRTEILAAGVWILCVTGVVDADSVDDAISTFSNDDYSATIFLVGTASKEGDASSQRIPGPMCENGLGAQQYYTEAARWYREAAELGVAEAQNSIGFMYEKGLGVTRNYVEAILWYREAAEQGLAAAQYNLGLMYFRGLGVPQDYHEVAHWFRKAAEQGLAEAQANIGFMYGKGLGVPQNYVESYKWFNLAGDAGFADATMRRNRIAKLMTPAQIVKAQQLAREWSSQKKK